MKIGVVGPGAMGCLLAGKLALSGNEVILLDHSKERAETINRRGLFIETGPAVEKVRVPATLDPQALSTAECICICVKAYDTRTVAEALHPLPRGPFFLTLQNGVGNVETLGRFLPQAKIIGGITSHGATDLGSGRVRHAGQGDTFIGYGYPRSRKDPQADPFLCRLQEVLGQAGFPTRTVADIRHLIWSKLLINVGINALTALTGLRNGRLLDYPGTRRLLEAAVEEGLQVGRKKGIAFVYPHPVDQVKKVCRRTEANISSMLQDVLKKRRTEVAFINGVIVREGRRLGLPVPVNTLLTALVQTIESSYGETLR